MGFLGLSTPWAAAIFVTACAVYINSLPAEFVFDDMPAIVNNADTDPAKTPLSNLWTNNFWGQPMKSPRAQHYSFRPITTYTFRLTVGLFGYWTPAFHAGNALLHGLASVLVAAVCLRMLPITCGNDDHDNTSASKADELHLSKDTASQAGQSHPPTAPSRRPASAKKPVKATPAASASTTPRPTSLVPGQPSSFQLHTAGLAGLLFALHPVHAEAVSNIVCRAELMCCIFVCLALLSYARACSATSSGQCVQWLATTFALTLVALLSKEQGITVLPVCMAYDLLVASKLDPLDVILFRWSGTDNQDATAGGSGSASAPKKTSRAGRRSHAAKTSEPGSLGLGARLAIVAVATAVMFQWRLSLNGPEEAKMDLKTNPANHIDDFSLRALTKNYYVCLHAWLLVWPVTLCCDWSSFAIPNIESFEDPRNLSTVTMYSVLALFVGVLGLGRLMGLARPVRGSLLVFVALAVATFIPASGLLVEVGFVVAERVLYLPSAGYCALLATLLMCVRQKLNNTRIRHLIDVACVVILVLYAGRTWMRNYEWESELALYESGVKTLPNNAKLHHNYARSITDDDKAEWHYRQAIRIYPPYASAYINLGVLQANRGQLAEAIQTWKDGLEAWRRSPIIGADPVFLAQNIGTALKNTGKCDEAIKYLKECLRYEPGRKPCVERLEQCKQQLGIN